MRRFWRVADIEATEEGFRVLLDGRPVRLPGGAMLVLPNPVLARAVAAEWQAAGGAEGGKMSFADVPVTTLAGTAQERVARDPAATVAALATYGASDLLCYRAAAPPALAALQAREWQPWLDWAARALDAPLRVTAGVMPIAQPDSALAALRAATAGCDIAALAALGLAVPALGSLVLGLALAAGEIDAAAAHRLAALDELYQAELWGEDSEAALRRDRIGTEIALAARFIALTRQSLIVSD